MVAETRQLCLEQPLQRQLPPRRRALPARAQAGLIFLVTAAVYWATATGVNTFDAVAYANQIGLAERTHTLRGLFHPHHLLFNVLGFLLWRGARASGYGGGPLVVLQRLNAVLGAAGVALFFLTFRRHVSARSTWGATAVLAASFGWWICATDGRVNMASNVLLLAAFGQALQILRTPSVKRAAFCGLLSGTAVLFHESAGLFVIVGLAGMALASSRQRPQRLGAYGGVWATIIVLPYLIVGTGLLHLHSPQAFRHWADAYAEQGQWWDFHVLRNLRRDVYALRHALFVEPPGRAAMGLNAHHAWLGRLWRTLALLVLRLLYGVTLTGWLAALAGLALALPRLLQSRHRRPVILCLLWIGVTGAFFTVWCPGYFVFWTPLLVPLLFLLTLALTEWRVRLPDVPLTHWAVAWTLLVVLTNATCGIGPHLRPGRTLWQRVAVDARAHTGPRDLLVIPGAGVDGQCEVDIPYFGNRACLSVHETLNQSRGDMDAAPAVMQARITRALLAGRRVYVYGEIWTDPGTVQALETHHPGLNTPGLCALFAGFRLVPAWASPRGPVYRLRLRHIAKTHGIRACVMPNNVIWVRAEGCAGSSRPDRVWQSRRPGGYAFPASVSAFRPVSSSGAFPSSPHYYAHFSLAPTGTTYQVPAMLDLGEDSQPTVDAFREAIRFWTTNRQRSVVRLWDILWQMADISSREFPQAEVPGVVQRALAYIRLLA